MLLIPAAGGGAAGGAAGLSADRARSTCSRRLLTFLAALSLFFGRPPPGAYLLVDDLNNVFIVLTTFVGFTTSVFSASYIGHELETGRLTPTIVRFYHAMYQVLMFAMNLALVANNIGLMWVAIELATLTTVLMVGIYRTHEALEAAWKYFILGSVGIALALFGTILVYMAARPVIGEGLDAMVWTVLVDARGRLRPGAAQRRLRVPAARLRHQGRAGAAACLAARRACRGPDADLGGAVGPAAQRRALCAAALQDAARRSIPAALAPGPLMVTMGLISLVFAAFMLYRRRDIKRMFAYSSIEHMGIITFAFGMGGPLANFAGLLHMTMHSLTKSAIFFAVGHIAQVKGTQKIADMGGLTVTQSGARLGAGARRRRHRRPAAARHLHERVPGGDARPSRASRCSAMLLVFGILIGVRRAVPAAQQHRLRRAARPHRRAKASYVPMFAHLALVFVAGIYLPPPLVAWFQNVAKLLG